MITLRLNWGSHAEVVTVYAYDTGLKVALVKLLYHGQQHEIDKVEVENLEAIENDAVGTMHPPEPILRKMAREILKRD